MALLLTLPLVLTACPGSTPPGETPTTTVSGTVRELGTPSGNVTVYPTVAWTGGAGSVQAAVYGSTLETTLTAPLSSSGTFSLNLPANVTSPRSVSFGSITQPGLTCTGTPTVSDAAAQFGSMDFGIEAEKSGLIAPAHISLTGPANAPTSVTYAIGQLLYADRAVNISGTQTCSSAEANRTYTSVLDLKLTQGWNKVTGTMRVTVEGKEPVVKSMSLSSGGFPSDEWIYLPVGMFSLQVSPSGGPANLRQFFPTLR